jgi:alpha,alpha-trehalase
MASRPKRPRSPTGSPRPKRSKSAAALPADIWPRLQLHISQMWPLLTRDLKHAVEATRDPKTQSVDTCLPVYVSASESPEAISAVLEKLLEPSDFAQVSVLPLPGAPEHITAHGVLYLPGRYVVPGGRFNELYGWDSYFIALGLLREGRTGLAQSLADQCLYEVEHYGAVLNCNRTYCLSRSHPPFLSRLVLAVFAQSGDLEWLRRALPAVERYHAYWQTPPHFTAATGLSRYHALGEGPAPEVVQGELDADGRNHYERVGERLRRDFRDAPWFAHVYDEQSRSLTAEGYRHDRTVRESGFDLTDRFGPCGLLARDFVPVCLNSLLWCLESDIAAIRRRLAASPESIAHWETMANDRAARMQDHFWDESEGLFLDWHLTAGQRSRYAYATAFMPLWAGWATPDQAARLARRLPDFLAPGGLLTSLERSGCQWDAPFTWAPLVLMAVEGLAAYGHLEPASDLGSRFLTLVAREFERTGQLFEKYDAVEGTSDVAGKILYGYPTNEPGFGWTNAVVGELLAMLAPSAEC